MKKIISTFMLFILFNISSSAQEKRMYAFNDTVYLFRGHSNKPIAVVLIDSAGKDLKNDKSWYKSYLRREAILLIKEANKYGDTAVLKYLTQKEIKDYDSVDAMKPWQPSPYFTTGEKMPYLKTKDLSGNKINSKKLKGKIIVYYFWEVLSIQSRREIPLLNKIRNEYKNDDEVVFLALTLNEPQTIIDFLKTDPFNFTIIDGAYFYNRLKKRRGLPVRVVADRNGKVYFHDSGFSDINPLWIKRSIEAIKHSDPTQLNIEN